MIRCMNHVIHYAPPTSAFINWPSIGVSIGARKVDLVLSVIVVVVLVAVVAQVLYAFAIYLLAVASSPEKLISLLRFETAELGVAVLSWLSILVTLLLPIFLFYAVRALADTFHPAWRIRRL